jgi:hypothetical protein
MGAAETARPAAPPADTGAARPPHDLDAFMAAYEAECAAHGVAPAGLAGHFQAVYLACNVTAWRDLGRGPFAKGRGR